MPKKELLDRIAHIHGLDVFDQHPLVLETTEHPLRPLAEVSKPFPTHSSSQKSSAKSALNTCIRALRNAGYDDVAEDVSALLDGLDSERDPLD